MLRILICLYLIILLGVLTVEAKVAANTDSGFVRISQITFKGNKITKDFVILREMSIRPGDSVPKHALYQLLEYNKERILNSKLFVEVHARAEMLSDSNVNFIYTVKELFYWRVHPFVSLADRNFNVWWDDYDHKLNRLNIGADINRINFRGRNEQLGIQFQAGFKKHIYLYYTNPFIDKSLKHGMSASIQYHTGKEIQVQTDSNKQVFFRDENTNPYRSLRAELSFMYRPRYASIHELKFSFMHYSITEAMFNEQPKFLMGGRSMNIPEIQYRFRFNNTNDRNYPLRGWEIDAIAEHKGFGLTKGFQQSQLYFHFARFQPILPGLSVAMHFRGRLFGPDNQPYFNYRGMGYKNDYVRGFEYYIIDGSHYGLARTDVRQKVFSYTLRQNVVPLLRYVPIDFYSKVFGDVGYVYSNNMGNSFLNNKIINGYGLGIDVIFSYYFKVRLEYSFNSLSEKGLFLHLRNE